MVCALAESALNLRTPRWSASESRLIPPKEVAAVKKPMTLMAMADLKPSYDVASPLGHATFHREGRHAFWTTSTRQGSPAWSPLTA